MHSSGRCQSGWALTVTPTGLSRRERRGLEPCAGDSFMSMKDDVLAALAKVASPQGQKLTETGTLSDVVVTDGKVFFSITVDAGAVKEWESVRARAEAATRAVPGVKSVLVALTAERASGVGGTAPRRRPQMPPAAARPREGGAPSPAGIPGVTSIIAVASGKGGVGKSTTA